MTQDQAGPVWSIAYVSRNLLCLHVYVLQLVLALVSAHIQFFFDGCCALIDCDEAYAYYVGPILSCRKRKFVSGTSIATDIEAKQKRAAILFAYGAKICIQLAWEHPKVNALHTENSWPISNPVDIIKYAVGAGLLHNLTLAGLPNGQSLSPQNQIRIAWSARLFTGLRDLRTSHDLYAS